MNELAQTRDDGSATPNTRTVAGRIVRLLTAASFLSFAVVATAVPATLAYGSPVACTQRTETQPFAPWGDYATYFRVLNGGFEQWGASWQLSGGASVVWGNEPWKVAGSGDSLNLKVPYGGYAESQTMCVTLGEDKIRLFVYNPGVSGSILHVRAVVKAGTQVAETAFDVNGDAAPRGYAPTMQFGVPKFFNGYPTQTLTVIFETRGAPATWYVDDVFVDPVRSY